MQGRRLSYETKGLRNLTHISKPQSITNPHNHIQPAAWHNLLILDLNCFARLYGRPKSH